MPVSDVSFMDPKSPVEKLQKIMKILERGSIEAHFTNEKNNPTLSREYLEMAFQDYAIQQQNPQVMNKWIALDTKLDKSLLEYVSDVKMLIASTIQTGSAQLSAGVNMPYPPPAVPEEGMSSTPEDIASPSSVRDRGLPVSRQ